MNQKEVLVLHALAHKAFGRYPSPSAPLGYGGELALKLSNRTRSSAQLPLVYMIRNDTHFASKLLSKM
jgi:hypothetical protein